MMAAIYKYRTHFFGQSRQLTPIAGLQVCFRHVLAGSIRNYRQCLASQQLVFFPGTFRFQIVQYFETYRGAKVGGNRFDEVAYLEKRFRVKPEKCVSICPTPKFQLLEEVKFLSSKGKLEYGTVIGIYWHGNDGKLFL
jgi:hypothetical protein